jgi:hypothetical protein
MDGMFFLTIYMQNDGLKFYFLSSLQGGSHLYKKIR